MGAPGLLDNIACDELTKLFVLAADTRLNVERFGYAYLIGSLTRMIALPCSKMKK
jgi:hypothetical protein